MSNFSFLVYLCFYCVQVNNFVVFEGFFLNISGNAFTTLISLLFKCHCEEGYVTVFFSVAV